MDTVPVPIRKRRTPEERRAEIILAATTLFARQGFERTTTREIAAEAGISEGTIYKYFSNKQEILFAFLQPVAFSTIPTLFQALDGKDDVTVIRAFIEDRFSRFTANRDIMRVVIGEALFNPRLAEGLHAMITPAVQVIEAYITRRIADGAFRAVDPTVAARTLISHLLAYFIKWSLLMPSGGQESPDQHLYDEFTALFLHGIQADATTHEVER